MKKIFIVWFLACTLLSGCGEGNSPQTNISARNYYTPDISKIGDDFEDGCSYLIDNNTGVVYLKYVAGYGKAITVDITVMLKPDGTPLMKEDIMQERTQNEK